MKDTLEKIGVSFIENESLARHTSFKIGGLADYYVEPSNEDELKELLQEVKRQKTPFFVMGNGSNLLVPDEGFKGVVIAIGEKFSNIELKANGLLAACAGILLSRIGRFALANALTGFEFAHGIPGSLGGGIYMNAGAYGGQMADVVERIYYLDDNLKPYEMSGKEAGFEYRNSIFKSQKGWIVTGADISLVPGNKDEINIRMKELSQKRRDKQPLEFPSAGSTFKRPEGSFAAKLIEDCGLKGTQIGGARVSEKHSGFVINTGGATCQNVLELMDIVVKTVYDHTGIELEPEVELMKPYTY